jgi:hypothetical protein
MHSTEHRNGPKNPKVQGALQASTLRPCLLDILMQTTSTLLVYPWNAVLPSRHSTQFIVDCLRNESKLSFSFGTAARHA